MNTPCASKTSRIRSPTASRSPGLELTGQRVLHAVDQRELGVPLPRLMHEPRVLERHAQAGGKRLQQLLLRLAERMRGWMF